MAVQTPDRDGARIVAHAQSRAGRLEQHRRFALGVRGRSGGENNNGGESRDNARHGWNSAWHGGSREGGTGRTHTTAPVQTRQWGFPWTGTHAIARPLDAEGRWAMCTAKDAALGAAPLTRTHELGSTNTVSGCETDWASRCASSSTRIHARLCGPRIFTSSKWIS